MPLPTPHELSVRRWQPQSIDRHGNPVEGWSDPIPWPVSGWASVSDSSGGAEPHLSNRDLVREELNVYAPKHENQPGPLDRVFIGDLVYEVEGEPSDYTYGPWQHPATGVVVRLRRMEG